MRIITIGLGILLSGVLAAPVSAAGKGAPGGAKAGAAAGAKAGGTAGSKAGPKAGARAGAASRGGRQTTVLGRGRQSRNARPVFQRAVKNQAAPNYYKKVAEHVGANRFYVPPQHWNKMTPTQQWTANQKFLDRAIARNDRFRLSTRPHLPPARSGYQRELAYLRSRGYKPTPGGKWMMPGASLPFANASAKQ